jgi:dihydrofolate synthase/folylpolyglutamate synthase
VEWTGRFQILEREAQTLVLDGAHNPAGAEALAMAMRGRFPGRRCTVVLGVLEDKKWSTLCELLAPLGTRILVAPVASPRSAPPGEVAAVCKRVNPSATVAAVNSLAEGLRQAGADELVLVTGSLYFIGEALELLGLGPAAGERALNDYTAQAELTKK